MSDKALTTDGAIRRFDGPEILFARAELRCPATGEVALHPGFADALSWLRMTFGRPMIVTSCCRSSLHNREIGGHPRSLHVFDQPSHGAQGTLAIDIARGSQSYNVLLIHTALEQGWSVGVGSTFFHLDRRDLVGLPKNVFGYGAAK